MTGKIKRPRSEINKLRKDIKAIFGLHRTDGAHVVNEGVVHDQQQDIQGDNELSWEETVKKLADVYEAGDELVDLAYEEVEANMTRNKFSMVIL